jgi:hypothetical protein
MQNISKFNEIYAEINQVSAMPSNGHQSRIGATNGTGTITTQKAQDLKFYMERLDLQSGGGETQSQHQGAASPVYRKKTR